MKNLAAIVQTLLVLCMLTAGPVACQKQAPQGGAGDTSAPADRGPRAPTPAAQGTETSGGGSFLEAMFRETAKRALQEMLLRYQAHPKTQEYFETLRPLIENEQLVKIAISKTPLKHAQKGEVDALNFPETKEIHLYEKVWADRFTKNEDVRVLVLHEYFGLAKIDDTDFKLSLLFFPATGYAPDYASTHVDCDVNAWGLEVNPGLQYPITWKTLPENFGVGALKERVTRQSREKTAELVIPFPRSENPSYVLAVAVKLLEADNSPVPVLFRKNAKTAILTYSARMFVRENGRPALIGTSHGQQTRSKIVMAEMPNLQIEKLIEGEGLPRNGNTDPYESWYTLRDGLAEKYGEANLYEVLLERLKGFPREIPISVTVDCEVGSLEELRRDKYSRRVLHRYPKGRFGQ
ncbi:MAG TPA: hypothetical protein VFV50_12820 [Bdellovibrionales bacterium]|nr:hypothetical protein [Bdellovibrionales bacterium]